MSNFHLETMVFRSIDMTTINDIAKALDVSKSTVSKALNGYPDVAAETHARVLEAAAELGYRPSAAAQSLSLGRTNRMGLFLNTSLDYVLDYLTGTIAQATRQANSHGKHLLLYAALDDEPNKLFEVFGSREIDGVILFSSNYPTEMLQALFEARYPFVIMGKQVDKPAVSYVVSDYYDGSVQGTEYLLAQGHRRIGFMTRPILGITSQQRLQGYLDTLAAAGVEPDENLIVETHMQRGSGAAAAQVMLDLPDPPTAIFAFHDLLAIEVIEVVRSRGLRVPQDVAVMGFDGLRVGRMISPHLTTIQQPLGRIGQRVVDVLNSRIEVPDAPVVQEVLPVELIIRDSA